MADDQARITRRHFLSLSAAVGAGALVASGVAEGQNAVDRLENASGNLISNASFETDSSGDGVPDGWQPLELMNQWKTVDYALDTTVARTGKASAKITGGKIYGDCTGVGSWAQRDVVSDGSGRTFALSVYARASEPTIVQLYLYGHDPAWGDDFNGAASEAFRVGPEWRKISHENSLAPSVKQVHVVLARAVQTFGGDVWFDDVELVEVTG